MSTNKKKIKVILILLAVFLSITIISNSTAADDNVTVKVPIKVNEFGFSREPLPFNQELYGYIDGTDFLNKNHTYYVTDEQMAGLYYASNKTFEYQDGLTVTYHKEDEDIMYGNIIVDNIYLPDGTPIEPVTGVECEEFLNNSVEIGKDCDLCDKYFGLTTSEFLEAE